MSLVLVKLVKWTYEQNETNVFLMKIRRSDLKLITSMLLVTMWPKWTNTLITPLRHYNLYIIYFKKTLDIAIRVKAINMLQLYCHPKSGQHEVKVISVWLSETMSMYSKTQEYQWQGRHLESPPSWLSLYRQQTARHIARFI